MQLGTYMYMNARARAFGSGAWRSADSPCLGICLSCAMSFVLFSFVVFAGTLQLM